MCWVIQAVTAMGNNRGPFSLVADRLHNKGRIVLPASSPMTIKLIKEFHSTPSGGHAGALRTFKRLATNVYWQGMLKQTRKYVDDCLVCQQNKYDSLRPAGLLQPLPIPNQVWEDLSMDFISGLPRSKVIDCILVVVDQLSKYAHFLGLRHPFTTRIVAEIFAKEAIWLHGVPLSIVTDRDPLFMSNF